MAAPLRTIFLRIFPQNLSVADCSILCTRSVHRTDLSGIRSACRNVRNGQMSTLCRLGMYVGAGVCLVGGASAFSHFSNSPLLTSSVSAAKSATVDQNTKPTRMVC